MKEYTITLKFTVESEDSDYDDINEFADELVENIMDNEELIYNDDIEIIEVLVADVQDNNDYELEKGDEFYGDDE
jgi:hypothetical protein